jgi:hypothetical protein
MKRKFMTIALMGVGMLGASAYGAGQVPTYGVNQAPAYGAEPAQPESANPGAVNYVEGAVFLDRNPLNRRDVGAAYMQPGAVLSTGKGNAEILLTPGVFLRLDENSAVKMVSPDLTKNQVELEKGRAAVEVDQIFPQNDLEVVDGGVPTQLVKPGFYEFSAGQPTAIVFVGKAAVRESNGKFREIKDHHEMALTTNGEVKPANFDTRDAQDDFYNWSALRSEYLAEGNNQIAGEYAGVQGFTSGWYWDPGMWDYTFIGMGPYWSPFGFGFYPPWGWYGGYWRGGFYGGRMYGGGFRSGFNGGFRGGFGGGGFHGGGFGGGGFHGGGGGGGHR